MGYESRIFVVRKTDSFASVIAIVNMGKMGLTGWKELFKAPIDFEFYYNEKVVKTDCYGDVPKYAEVSDVLNWLENDTEHYYMKDVLEGILKPLEILKGFKVIHYGY